MIFSSFPWPMLSSCSQSIIKTIYYLRYILALWRIKCVLVFIFLLELKLVFWLVCCFFNFCFLPARSQNFYCFSMTFHYPHFNFWIFQAWKMELWNSTTFQVFHDPYEPWITFWIQKPKPTKIWTARIENALVYNTNGVLIREWKEMININFKLYIQHLQPVGNYFVPLCKLLVRWVSRHPVDDHFLKKIVAL